MSYEVINGNALALPIEDETVDLIVTSPPYFALRSYRDDGEHYDGQVGSEATPQEFLEALWAATAEMVRVLKPSGSIWVNLGDKYAGSGGHSNAGISAKSTLRGNGHRGGVAKDGSANKVKATLRSAPDRYNQNSGGIPAKSLMGLPWRYAIGCVDQLGLILRAEVIWSKPNGLPESVTDRVRRSHEQWFHFTKSPRYFAAVDEVREAHQSPIHAPGNKKWAGERNDGDRVDKAWGDASLGKLPGSVWTIPSEPLIVPEHLGLPDHFACVDDQTEILTTRGWLRHDALEVGDRVAGYNLDIGTAEWTDCHAIHRYDYDGELVAVDKRDLSMRLTPNHRCIVRRPHSATPLVDAIVEAGEIGPRHAIPRSADWVEPVATKSIGADLAALCGWVAAEGWYDGGRTVRLSQSLTVNPENVATLDRLLAGAKRREAQRSYNGRPWVDVTWTLTPALAAEVRRLMPTKRLGAWVLELPRGERQALLDAFIDGDGHRRPDCRIGIYQKERENLDVLQAVAVTLGYKTTLRRGTDKWTLFLTTGGRAITLRGTNGVNATIPREHYRGTVWCPTTGTGTFIARRNGSVFITGNSFPQEWPRRIILGWSPSGICTACGEGRRPVVEKTLAVRNRNDQPRRYSTGLDDDAMGNWTAATEFQGSTEATITGYACACTPYTDHDRSKLDRGRTPPPNKGQLDRTVGGRSAGRAADGWVPNTPPEPSRREYHFDQWTPPPTTPARVLDPFGGTGTVAGVAHALGRHGISVDLSQDYCRLAEWRIGQSGHFQKAYERSAAEGAVVPLVAPKDTAAGRLSLFDEAS